MPLDFNHDQITVKGLEDIGGESELGRGTIFFGAEILKEQSLRGVQAIPARYPIVGKKPEIGWYLFGGIDSPGCLVVGSHKTVESLRKSGIDTDAVGGFPSVVVRVSWMMQASELGASIQMEKSAPSLRRRVRCDVTLSRSISKSKYLAISSCGHPHIRRV